MIEVHRYRMMTAELFTEWMDVYENLAEDERFELVECAEYARALSDVGATLRYDAAGRLFVRIDDLQPI